MKKLLLSFFISGAFMYAAAQPTWDFESWTGSGTGIEPNGWVSGNVITGAPFNNPQSAFKDSVNVHGGSYAMKLVTVDVTNNPSPTLIPDPIGIAFVGTIIPFPTSLKMGFQYTSRPASADFWYRYTPVGSDSASALIWLTKWNGASRDTVAIGWWGTGTAQAAYTNAPITLTYLSATLFPDTMGILVAATKVSCLTCGTVNSTLWVDDITFTGWNGINEHPSSNDVIVYPNPASNYTNIIADVTEASSVILYDVTGKEVSSESMTQSISGMNRKEANVNTASLSAGVYSYAVVDKNGTSLRIGKFSVVH